MMNSVNPATGEEIAAYAELSKAEVNAKLDQAASAFRAWRQPGLHERTTLLTKIAEAYDANKDRLARMATQEMGKTYTSAVAEVEKCAAAFRHYAKEGPAMLAPRRVGLAAGGSAEVRWLPQGPVLWQGHISEVD